MFRPGLECSYWLTLILLLFRIQFERHRQFVPDFQEYVAGENALKLLNTNDNLLYSLTSGAHALSVVCLAGVFFCGVVGASFVCVLLGCFSACRATVSGVSCRQHPVCHPCPPSLRSPAHPVALSADWGVEVDKVKVTADKFKVRPVCAFLADNTNARLLWPGCVLHAVSRAPAGLAPVYSLSGSYLPLPSVCSRSCDNSPSKPVSSVCAGRLQEVRKDEERDGHPGKTQSSLSSLSDR
jgi:hypothetical protein